MSINGVNYNPYLFTAFKAANDSYRNMIAATYPAFTANNNNVDTFESNKENNKTGNKEFASELRKELEETKSQQGLIGKAWDGLKNLTGRGAGSDKAEQAIEDFENGKISQQELKDAVEGYKEGQKQCVDMVADITAGIAAFAAFSLATGIGIAASPFTGGASLGLVATGFGIAGAAGAMVKVGVKCVDCAVGGREYDTLGYDIATGGMNGMFAPISAGIGGAAGKAVANRVGVTAISEGGEVIVKEALEDTVKGTITKTLLTTNVRYIGGTFGARTLALGTDMAVNGAITGAVDSGTRYVAGDKENKSIEGFAKEVGMGAIGGFVLAPVIGGGMRAAGNGIGKMTGKLQEKVASNLTEAKSAMMNTPVVENPDMEVVRGLGVVIKKAQDLVDDVQASGSNIFEGLNKSVSGLNENVSNFVGRASVLNTEIGAISKEQKELVVELLNEISQGKDVSSKISDLAKRGISITEMLSEKLNVLHNGIDQKLSKGMAACDSFAERVSEKTDLATQTFDRAIGIANEALEQARKIPETNAYKQLGDLPDRASVFFKSIMSEADELDQVAKAAYEKIHSGDVKGGLESLLKYYKELEIFNKKLGEKIASVESGAARSGLDESIEVLRDRLAKLTASEKFQNMTREEQIQAIMENSNIFFSKFAQTFSSNDSLPPEVQKIFKQFTSNCTVSRNATQAQNLADELYGAGKYTILKSFGAGTIGETYLAKTADGTEVVIKMLKEGVNPEKFAQDRAMFTKYINEFVTDSTEKEYKLKLINSMFDAWDKELDFALEAQGAKSMAEGAKRFSVAQTLEVGSKNGQNISLVMEKANGVKLDSLLEMIKLYKENPTEYYTKYAKDIKANPALKTPETWMGELSAAYERAQNEQLMFVGKNGTRTIHADPHPGNVFVDFDAVSGKPKIVYIDAGNVVDRTNSQTLQDIALSLNMIVGNSKGIANAMLEGATLPEGASREEIVKRFAELLDEKMYRAGVDLTSTQYTQSTISGIMKELNVIADPGNSNLLKATLQRIETQKAINKVCGTGSNEMIEVKDMISGIIKSLKVNPKETWKTIKPIIQWAYQNNDRAMVTFFQMITEKPVVDNSALAIA